MEPQEIDSALDELENRLDRLRSLYEQYFMGIEKIEPTVPRKDVDRRFWILRRTQIRNTARRFRLQTLVQRYNTFQQHWTRICREIENGTYVRHLLKAKKNLGAEPKTWAAKKRLGLFRRDRPDSKAPPGETTTGSDGAAAPGGNGVSSYPPQEQAAARAQPSVAPAAPSSPPRPSQQNLTPLDLDLDEALTLPPPPRAKPPLPARPIAAPKPASAIPMPAGASPAALPIAPSAAARPSPPATAAARPAQPATTSPASPARPPRAPAPPGAARPAPPATASAASPSPAQSTIPRPAIPRPASLIPKPLAAPTAAPAERPAPLAAPAPRVERPAPAPRVERPAATANAAASLSDERVAQLHAELNAARRQLNQSSSSVSIDSLAKSLRETETKLKTQHGGRSVDFQVVIKDGKPIVKPVVRR